MRLMCIKNGLLMTVRELFRSRFVMILLFIIPAVFYTITVLTTTMKPVGFKLAAVSETMLIIVHQRSEALIFIGLAAVGLLASFLALNLIQRSTQANRRLVICGYRSSELAFSKLLVLLGVIVVVGGYIAAAVPLFFKPRHFMALVLGFILIGYIYGCFGLLVGAVVRRELEGILLIVLLTNIDVTWLQNPIFYAEAQNRAIIRWLPAFFPSQTSMISAFTNQSIWKPVLWSICYGSIFLAAALLLFWRKMHKQN